MVRKPKKTNIQAAMAKSVKGKSKDADTPKKTTASSKASAGKPTTEKRPKGAPKPKANKFAKKKLRWHVEDLDLPEKDKLHAVAINYDVEKDRAPKIVASGKGSIAEKILSVAAQNEVPLCSDPSLTDLLSKLEMSQEIPPELYTVVAEVLAFVYQLNKLSKKGSAVRKKFANNPKIS